jgi:hypothetical protein
MLSRIKIAGSTDASFSPVERCTSSQDFPLLVAIHVDEQLASQLSKSCSQREQNHHGHERQTGPAERKFGLAVGRGVDGLGSSGELAVPQQKVCTGIA